MVPRIVLVDGASRPHYYIELQRDLRAEWIVPAQPRAALSLGLPDIALVSDEFNWETSIAIRELARSEVPVLHIADGVVEWRNNWENPRSLSPEAGLPLFQPVLSHKIACIGRSQSRILESWGNLGKCEVVGVSRFDRLLGRKPRQRAATESFRILVVTAKTPGFTPEQMARARQALVDLKQWFMAHASVEGIVPQPSWRLTAGLDEAIGALNELYDTTGDDLAAALEQVDAVITTPSTSMLEGMLQGVPVALLDYNNCPHYVPAAWTITAREHLDRVIPELIDPPEAKLLYQDTILHDALECRTPAAPRMARLVEEMIRVGRECRSRGEPLKFPRRMLPDEQDGHHLPEERFDLRRLYPEHAVFANLDRAALQVELGHLHVEAERLRRELQWQRQRCAELVQERNDPPPEGALWRGVRKMWYGKKSA